MTTYKVVRHYQSPDHANRVIRTGLSFEEATDHCTDPETSSNTATSEEAQKHTSEFGPWFDGYDEEDEEEPP